MNTLTTPTNDQPAFTQNGRKGVTYDWRSLCDFSESDIVTDDREPASPAIAYS
ncbi:MAG: hypothetical protein HY826_12125 [Actinobacteria bacterium]|nr:hypothetical protein [Actinomycetota bacterium]